MENVIDDQYSSMNSVVRFEPNVNIRFLAEELRRYGIKTNSKNEKGKTVFFQSSHIIMSYDQPDTYDANNCLLPSMCLVSFKDLFKLIGKNDAGADDQDIVRTWYIAEKLEKRRMITITGVKDKTLDGDDKPDLPDVYANMHHIHRNDTSIDSFVYKSKFATNKRYSIDCGYSSLMGVSDFFIMGN